jgi:superfamily I DNA/RNA helicase
MKPSEAKQIASCLINDSVLPITDKKLKHVWDIMLKGENAYSPAISFQMIAKLALLIVNTNSSIRTVIRATFSHVFLDEFQDTTDIQYEIVKALFKDTDVKLTAVGDNKQRIMLWAGARKTVFLDFYREFNTKNYKLLMNHRSAPRLVELQKNMYVSLHDNPDNITASTKWDEDDGIINLVIADNNNVEANILAKMIQNDISGGVKQNDIAILCKQKVNDYVGSVINALDKKGIRARVETDYQDLLKDDIIKILLAIIVLANNRKSPEEWEYIQAISEQVFNIVNASTTAYLKMIEDLEDLFSDVYDSLTEVDSESGFSAVQNMIINFYGEDNLKALFPDNKQGTYLDDKLQKFTELFWKEVEIANKDWHRAVKGFKGEESIPIMTIHKSKGLEYDSVYFMGLEDSAFWNFKNQSEEERCAFFVALSRAKRKITFTYCEYRYNFKYSKQNRLIINEFYELLKKPGMANLISAKEESL